MKNCSKCLRLLPRDLFNKRVRSLDGLQAWCRECNRKYHGSAYATVQAARPPAQDVLDRLTDRTVFDETVTGCWVWKGSCANGYGRMSVNGRTDGTHRLGYEALVGPIPEGLTLDHLCRNTRCWNPRHLEPVTHGENCRRGNGWSGRNARKTHCPAGHSYDSSNTYLRPDGTGRDCIACRTRRISIWNAQAKAAS